MILLFLEEEKIKYKKTLFFDEHEFEITVWKKPFR